MNEITFALLSEGASDAALLPVVTWVFRQQIDPTVVVGGSRVDEGRLPKASTPSKRLESAIDVYPCDFLILHRDANGAGWEARQAEIIAWCNQSDLGEVKTIPIIPVCETEAWLLIDEHAIRRAAGNPNGRADLHLPPPNKIELLPNPKEHLLQALRIASGLAGRRLKKFNEYRARLAIGKAIVDYAVLRQLNAFVRFEDEVRKCIDEKPDRSRD